MDNVRNKFQKLLNILLCVSVIHKLMESTLMKEAMAHHRENYNDVLDDLHIVTRDIARKLNNFVCNDRKYAAQVTYCKDILWYLDVKQ